MKIYELIERLADIQKEHGNDIEVKLYGGDWWISTYDVEYREFEEDEPSKLVIIS
jgi:hypothetical protein